MSHFPTVRIGSSPTFVTGIGVEPDQQCFRAARGQHHCARVDQRALSRIPGRNGRAILPHQVDAPAQFAGFGAQAQDTAGYPARPVKIIVPFAPAGPTDTMARLIAQKLSDSLGKQFYIENHPGAGGNLGMAMVANAAPDGYTLLLVSSSVVVNPSLYEKVPYDVYKSLAPVTLAGSSPNILVVHPSVPAKTS